MVNYWVVFSQDDIDEFVSSEFLKPHLHEAWCFRAGNKTTVCLVKLKNGFEVVGTSACIDEKKYSADLGQKYSLEDALRKCEQLIGFYNQQSRHEGKEWTDATDE
jgi:hypothetical protein